MAPVCEDLSVLPTAQRGIVTVDLDRDNPAAGTTFVAFALVPRNRPAGRERTYPQSYDDPRVTAPFGGEQRTKSGASQFHTSGAGVTRR